MRIRIYFIAMTIIVASCIESKEKSGMTKTEIWRLGWRMVASSWEENYQMAEKQFDSLLTISNNIDFRFLITGLETLYELDKKEKLIVILSQQNENKLQEICNSDLFTQKLKDVKACENVETEQVQNSDLQMELIQVYIDDQVARGNVMEDLIEKYNLNKDNITKEDGVTVDARNRNKLKEIFQDYGFPTKEMVGKDAMNGIFLIIQHADGDKEWQMSQLPNIEKAVKKGDLDGQSYAYLYDRIRINSGEKQLYGTQFSNVDPVNNTVTLAETEDIENLDKRRMEVRMMPIDMYKKFMLKYFFL